MTTSTALVHVPAAPDLAGEAAARRADRFVAHAAALSPAAWGALDAIGARWAADDAFGSVARTRFLTGALEAGGTPAPLTVLAGVGALVGDLTLTAAAPLLRALGVRGGADKRARRPRDARAGSSPEARRVTESLQRLWDVAAARPGGVGPALAALSPALLAVASGRIPGPVAARLYAPAEPFIPRASLDAAPAAA